MATPDSATWQRDSRWQGDSAWERHPAWKPDRGPEGEVSTGARLVDALDGLTGAVTEVSAAAVVSLDGLTMASALPDDVDEDHVGAMSAALLSLGEQAASGLGRGVLRELVVDTDGGLVLCSRAGAHAVLVAVTHEEAKLGLVRHELRRTAEAVAEALDGAEHADPEPRTGPALTPFPVAESAPRTGPVAHPQADASITDEAAAGPPSPDPDRADYGGDASADGLEEFAALTDDPEVRWRPRSLDLDEEDFGSDPTPPWAARRYDDE